uniref:Uncharacterized protein n=1 Tax=Acrobeloides nanus TaxID=290746 RepID=A0A914CGH2_9BILA
MFKIEQIDESVGSDGFKGSDKSEESIGVADLDVRIRNQSKSKFVKILSKLALTHSCVQKLHKKLVLYKGYPLYRLAQMNP